LWPKSYTLEVGSNRQKILRYLTKYASFWRIIYSLQTFTLGCIRTPWGDGPQFGTIL